MREILLHGSTDEAFDRSVTFARRLAESFEARLHVVYTVEDPISAGWTSEVGAERLPEVHQAMEAEAREPAVKEILAYANENAIDLAIVQARGGAGTDLARALLDHGRSAVLVLR